jgi:hypothetical protein
VGDHVGIPAAVCFAFLLLTCDPYCDDREQRKKLPEVEITTQLSKVAFLIEELDLLDGLGG